jgi:cell division protein FtsZ
MNDFRPEAIKIIGVGATAGRAVDGMYRNRFGNASFLACDTDGYSLQHLSAPTYRLGESIMKGIAEDSCLQTGCAAARASSLELQRLLLGNAQAAIVTACMSGGTETGAAPVIAQAAKDAGLFVAGIATLPFLFEGKVAISKAMSGAEEMGRCADVLAVFDSERIRTANPDLNIVALFDKLENVLTRAVERLAAIISGKKPANNLKSLIEVGFNINDFIG